VGGMAGIFGIGGGFLSVPAPHFIVRIPKTLACRR
jgi:uncharacterized membrane protein YfcA